jgi:hypothetical protein
MSTEKSELHVTNIEREDKGRWVSSARAQKITLAEWAIKMLNDAAKHTITDSVRPVWVKELSKRSAHALVNAGYINKRGVQNDFKKKGFDPMQIQNLGRSGVEEVLAWLVK